MMWEPHRNRGALLTDLYHVDAAYVSWRSEQNALATFELYTRTHPFSGGYLLTAGLELAVAFVHSFRYTDDDLAFLEQRRGYETAFLEELRNLRFTGELLAIPEGTVAFADEPLVRVSAPFREALVLESGLLHTISVSTLIATKAARVVQAAAGRPVAEFAFRRAQAPFIVTRSAYIGGCATSSFLAAARDLGLPVSGTVPHALIQAFASEEEAFAAIAASLNPYTLLLDTYDTRRAVHTAARVARAAHERWGHTLAAVRLDSGDLTADSAYIRQVLDEAGLQETRILASGDLDEFKIQALLQRGAPIDGFGVGTSIGVGAGSLEHRAPGGALGAVYKLAWYEGSGDPARMKVAGEKSTWPGKKLLYRFEPYVEDRLQLEDEPAPAGATPVLEPVLQEGTLVSGALPPLTEIRARAARSLESLPARYRALQKPAQYPVRRSARLQRERKRLMRAR